MNIEIITKDGLMKVCFSKLNNILIGEIGNYSFPIGKVYKEHTSEIIQRLKEMKQTKQIKNLIDYYQNLDKVTDSEILEKELDELVEEAEKENIIIYYSLENKGYNPYVYLNRIEIENGYDRRKGLGTKYMNKLINICSNHQFHLSLNPSADYGMSLTFLREFYKKLGFKKCSVIGISDELVYDYKKHKNTTSK